MSMAPGWYPDPFAGAGLLLLAVKGVAVEAVAAVGGAELVVVQRGRSTGAGNGVGGHRTAPIRRSAARVFATALPPPGVDDTDTTPRRPRTRK